MRACVRIHPCVRALVYACVYAVSCHFLTAQLGEGIKIPGRAFSPPEEEEEE